MEQLTLLLLERMGLLLIIAFMLTRTSLFRQLIEGKPNLPNVFYFSLIFGIFGIAGVHAGVVVTHDQVESSFWVYNIGEDQVIANSALVGVVIGGLLGGSLVGLGAGVLTGLHLYHLDGFAALAMALSAPVTGLAAGGIAKFFSDERVISPAKAMFVGMFAPIIQMGFILIFSSPPQQASAAVNAVGMPMVLTNSIAIAVFTAMIHVVLKEEERAAAFETRRALKIAEMTLPHLRQGLTPATADAAARILHNELKADAVAVTDTQRILAHVGIGTSSRIAGEEIQSVLSREAIRTGEVKISYDKADFQPHHPSIGAVIIVPFSQSGKVAGLIKLYFKRPEQIRKIEEVLASGLGNLITYQLNTALAEKMDKLMKDSELRLLQAQINPHFLFNTLNSIVSLVRINPDLARHLTVQLGTFMRLNLKITQHQLITIAQEIQHLTTYLEIVKVRFADQFTVSTDIQEGLGSVLIPPSCLQPLVENSIQHGLKGMTSGGIIRINIYSWREDVHILIEDNGTGVPPEIIDQLGKAPLLKSSGAGIGLFNVNQRLISMFGRGIGIENNTGRGCRITFSIPLRSGE
ncbi:LytS/YhcK type 5TM receptor domain-containing protein [Paenibacillus alkalitolerans]|uniref:LytS/YhcK type 5TM receptor domain-containing protein n=1 Tax=Paenibacillus alkalitolerans TaxID=2799335 RepID=UPI0018F41160|nr:LytS/YhcK type 5TM receptor domain-containing protein [Paenibacillus alkalitolerans]